MPLPKNPRILILSNAPGAGTPPLEMISEAAVLDQVLAVEETLSALGYQSRHIAIRNLAELLQALGDYVPQLVFNLCEGLDGNSAFESHVAAVLELLRLPFTGGNALALALARNKNLSKKILRASGILTPEWLFCQDIPSALPPGLHFPLLCKPACEDASLGIPAQAVARDLPGLHRNLALLLPRFAAEGVLVEEFIAGREFNVALLPDAGGIRALPPAEIDFSQLPPGEEPIVSYAAKWLEDDVLYKNTPSFCPADLTESLLQGLRNSALAVHAALQGNSYARVDFRVDEHGRIFVLEYNPNPDITPGAGYSKALQAAGISGRDFIQRVLQEAWQRSKQEHLC